MARRGALGTLALLLLAANGSAASWVDALATLAAPDAQPTVATLRTVLAPPFGGIAVSSGCQVALQAARSGAPSLAAMTLQAPDGCQDGAVIARLQILLAPVGARELAGLRQQLMALAGRPCFEGAYVANSRRHAPPLQLLAWSGRRRLLVLTRDDSMPDGVSVTFERRDLHPTDAADAASQGAAIHVLPLSCRPTG